MTDFPPRQRSCGSLLNKPQEWEHPDRPLVRDIYIAEEAGWRINDMGAWNTYRIALTSPRDLDANPPLKAELEPIAEQARKWLTDHGIDHQD
ncbi:MAG TPA: hypothetical protein VF442_03490 [Sphingobium sp.]